MQIMKQLEKNLICKIWGFLKTKFIFLEIKTKVFTKLVIWNFATRSRKLIYEISSATLPPIQKISLSHTTSPYKEFQQPHYSTSHSKDFDSLTTSHTKSFTSQTTSHTKNFTSHRTSHTKNSTTHTTSHTKNFTNHTTYITYKKFQQPTTVLSMK